MGIIDFYEGDNTYKDARKAKMKALSAKWLTLLNEAHADVNFSGTQFFLWDIADAAQRRRARGVSLEIVC